MRTLRVLYLLADRGVRHRETVIPIPQPMLDYRALFMDLLGGSSRVG